MSTSDEIITEIINARTDSLQGVEYASEEIEYTYRNKLIDNISLLLDSIQLNLSKVSDDQQHLFVSRLIEAENALRSLNEEINSYCDASNNVAMKDAEDGFVDFPDDEL